MATQSGECWDDSDNDDCPPVTHVHHQEFRNRSAQYTNQGGRNDNYNGYASHNDNSSGWSDCPEWRKNGPRADRNYERNSYSDNTSGWPEQSSGRNAPRTERNFDRNSYSDKNSAWSEQTSSRNSARTEKNFDRSSDDATIEILSNLVGKFIGKGGSNIRKLEQESGARIKLVDNDWYSKTIQISGSAAAKETAKQLIEEFLADDSSSKNLIAPLSEQDKKPTQFVDWTKLNQEYKVQRTEKLAALPPIRKDFYVEDEEVKQLTRQQVALIRERNNSITVSYDGKEKMVIPNPILIFEHAFQPYPELLVELEKQRFTTPSPIQSQAWPIILKGHDMIGIAQTGTGKTIAFLFPAYIHIMGQNTPRHERKGPSCLVLAPTRELAQQIEEEAKKYSYCGITCVCVYGGGSRRDQVKLVTKGVDIVIATPGRVWDLIASDTLDVLGVTYLVLDEADRMLDMGFEPQIRRIVLGIRPDRQTIMTSATWTNEVQSLAARYMTNPIKVNVGALDLAATHSVTQDIIIAEDEDRREILDGIIQNMAPDDKLIVFVDRKSVADDVSSDLQLNGVDCQSIHGDREQSDREQALSEIRSGEVRILVATDVASRGLDIKDITHIFNMYFPRNIEEYVHRIGRTGRAGRTGTAITIFTRRDWRNAEALIKILAEADQEVPQELHRMADAFKRWKAKKDAEDAAAGGRRPFRKNNY